MKSTIMDYPLTLNHLLERMRILFPTVEVVTRHPDKSYSTQTYGDTYRRARALAEALNKAGYKDGDRIATLCWNHGVHFEAYFGIPAAGCVMHTLNLRLSPHDIAYIANHAEDKVVIVDDDLVPLFEQFKGDIKAERVLVVPYSGQPVPEGYENYEDFIATATGDWDYPEIAETDGCAMCYTSGTTGVPKGVIYSHRGMVLHSITSCIPDMLNFSQNDVITPVVPMFHANAWGIPYSGATTGAKMIFPGPHLDAVSLLDLFEEHKVTFSGGVPTIWLGIVQAMDKEPDRWKLVEGIRTVVGGSAAPPALIRRLDEHGIYTIHAWGMTEMSPLGTVATVKPHLASGDDPMGYKYRSLQGVQAPLVDLRATDDEGGQVPWDGETMGELEVRGPWIAASYHNNPDAQDRWTDDGWFKTGDIVVINDEGYVQITDRSKDVIKSGGEWISSVDLENAIMGHPAVAEAAVIALPHPKWDERPLACVVVKEGESVTPDEIREFLSSDFAKWQLPDAVIFIDEVPKTSTGKFQKLALRKQFEDFDWDDAEKMAS